MSDFFGSIIDGISEIGGDLFDSVEKSLTDISFKDIIKAGGEALGGKSKQGESTNPYSQELSYAKGKLSDLPASTRARLQQSSQAKPVASVDPREYYREWSTRLREMAYQAEQSGK